MGIQIEFNPDLALRDMEEFRKGNRQREECIPYLEEGKTYSFVKEGQRNYWLQGEIPLVEKKGEGKLSRPLASIIILEATHHFVKELNKIYTEGEYLVKKVFDPKDPTIHFEAMKRRK